MSKKAGGINSADHNVAQGHMREFSYNSKRTLVYVCSKNMPDKGLLGNAIKDVCCKKHENVQRTVSRLISPTFKV